MLACALKAMLLVFVSVQFILSVIGIFVRVTETFYVVCLLFSALEVNRRTYIEAVCSVNSETLPCRQH